jgi:hypothetical protein
LFDGWLQRDSITANKTIKEARFPKWEMVIRLGVCVLNTRQSFSLAFRSLTSLSSSKMQTLQIKVGRGNDRVISLLSMGRIWEVTEIRPCVLLEDAHVTTFQVTVTCLCLPTGSPNDKSINALLMTVTGMAGSSVPYAVPLEIQKNKGNCLSLRFSEKEISNDGKERCLLLQSLLSTVG